MTQPYKCPVCKGRGSMPGGFYESIGNNWVSRSHETDPCRSCNRTGLVWEPAITECITRDVDPVDVEKYFSDQELIGEKNEEDQTPKKNQ
jgi:molybdenum cofactor biosynthesis enzyme MoaA